MAPRRTVFGDHLRFKNELDYGEWEDDVEAEDEVLDKKASVMGPFTQGGKKGPFWFREDKYWFNNFCYSYLVSKEVSTVRPPVPSQKVYESEKIGELDVDAQDCFAAAIYDRRQMEFVGSACMEAYRKKYSFDATKTYPVDYFDESGELQTVILGERESLEMAGKGEASEAGFWFCGEKYHITKRVKSQKRPRLQTQATGISFRTLASDSGDEEEGPPQYEWIFANRPHRGMWLYNDNINDLIFIALWRGDPDVNGFNCQLYLKGAHEKFITQGWCGERLIRWRKWIKGEEDLEWVQHGIQEMQSDPYSVRRRQHRPSVEQLLEDANLWLTQARLSRSTSTVGQSFNRLSQGGEPTVGENLILHLHEMQGKIGRRVFVYAPTSSVGGEKKWYLAEIIEDSFNGKFQVRVEGPSDPKTEALGPKFAPQTEVHIDCIFQEHIGRIVEVSEKNKTYRGQIVQDFLNNTFLVRCSDDASEERVEIERITWKIDPDFLNKDVWIMGVDPSGGATEEFYPGTVLNKCEVAGKGWYRIAFEEVDYPHEIVDESRLYWSEVAVEKYYQDKFPINAAGQAVPTAGLVSKFLQVGDGECGALGERRPITAAALMSVSLTPAHLSQAHLKSKRSLTP